MKPDPEVRSSGRAIRSRWCSFALMLQVHSQLIPRSKTHLVKLIFHQLGKTFPTFIKPESPFPSSPDLANGPSPCQMNLAHILTAYIFMISFNIFSTPTSFMLFLSSGPPPKPRMNLSSHPRLPNIPSLLPLVFHHPKKNQQRMQIIKPFIARFSSASCYFLPLWCKHFSWHSLLKHPQF